VSSLKEVAPDEFFNRFKPEKCVFVISVDTKGKPSGMVAGWITRCSSEPPLLAVALWKGGYTHRLIRQSKEFVIAVPNKGLEKDLLLFGSTHGDKVDKFRETGIETIPAKHVRSPLLKKATANLECALVKEVDSGDHIIFIGKILAAHCNSGKKVLMNMGKKNGKRQFKEF